MLAACAQPGASVAAVALSFKLNDKLVHQWRRGCGANFVSSATSTTVADSAPHFIALSLPSPPPPSAPTVDAVAAESIHLEFQRGALWLCTKPVGSGQACMVVRRQRTGWSGQRAAAVMSLV